MFSDPEGLSLGFPVTEIINSLLTDSAILNKFLSSGLTTI